MKIIFIISLSILFHLHINAQKGKVIYDQTQKMNIQVEGLDDHIKNVLPSMSETTKELSYDQSVSLYQDITEEKLHEFTSDHDHMGNGAMVQVKTRASQERTYFDHSENIRIDQKEIMGKLFLIETDVEKPKWKMLNEQKDILGYACMKAGAQKNDSVYIEAWFTPQIQVFAGPEEFFGLPGLILEINENDGEKVIKARKIDLESEVIITKPEKGDKVSQEKFNKIREQKIKEMEEMYNLKSKNGNGVFIIRQG